MGHVTRMNESCHTYEWVMSHVWMSHVTHMNESCHTYESVVRVRNAVCHTHIGMSHTHRTKCWNGAELFHPWMSYVIYQWIMSVISVMSPTNEPFHVWMSRVIYQSVMCVILVISRMNESFHVWMSHVIYQAVMSPIKDSFHVWTSPVAHTNESCHAYNTWYLQMWSPSKHWNEDKSIHQ